MNNMTLTCHNGNSASEVRYLASGELGFWRGTLVDGSTDEGERLTHLGESRRQKSENGGIEVEGERGAKLELTG